MLRNTPVRALVLAIVAFLATILVLPSQAFAGTLQVRDESHVLTPEAVSQLRSIVAGAPFDARLAFTSEYADAEELSRYVGTLVREPNMIAVGVDPQHHHVRVHYGTGSGIARSEWDGIDHAGTAAFRDGRWEDGAAAIFKAAEHAVGTAPVGDSGGAPRVAQPSRVGSGLVIFFIVIAAVAAFAFFGRRRSTYGGGYDSGYGPGYGPPGPGYGGGYGGPNYGPPPAQGMGPLGGGLIGAGLGGLAGYELGKMEGEREGRDRDRVVEDDRRAPDDNYDAGGGGDSWGDDNGGGFDGGGGGGDSGGGGSDF